MMKLLGPTFLLSPIRSTIFIFFSDKIRAERSRYFMRLVLVRQRDKLDILFRHYLCEDKAAPGASGASIDNFSYVDFLCHMHKEIRALLG